MSYFLKRLFFDLFIKPFTRKPSHAIFFILFLITLMAFLFNHFGLSYNDLFFKVFAEENAPTGVTLELESTTTVEDSSSTTIQMTTNGNENKLDPDNVMNEMNVIEGSNLLEMTFEELIFLQVEPNQRYFDNVYVTNLNGEVSRIVSALNIVNENITSTKGYVITLNSNIESLETVIISLYSLTLALIFGTWVMFGVTARRSLK